MLTLATILLAGHLSVPTPVPIDFRLLPPGADSVITNPATRREPSYSEEIQPDTPPRRSERPQRPVFPPVQGFGTDVPLSFAVRQIVPRGHEMVYRNGARPDDLVSWVGNKPWPRVLQDAIRPLGLRMTLAGNTITLSR